jgi:uncharacterized membrane protein
MGENHGWFFGDYDFTDALGLRWFGVPVVIPLMWFNLTYISFVLANVLLFRSPLNASTQVRGYVLPTFLSAALVTAYDLAADPYMVFVIKAWKMEKTDGWWFGETLQGFVGWFVVSFVIVFVFNVLTRHRRPQPCAPFKKINALIPISIYMNWMIFQVLFGYPMETRTISLFAMGIPLVIALFSINTWQWDDRTGTSAR